MFHLRAYGTSREMADAGAQLERTGVARHVAVAPAVLEGHSVLTAEVSPESADEVLGFMHDRGVTPDDVALARVEEIGRGPRPGTGASLIWADVVGQANVNARPLPRYVVLMIVAGVIAAYGVIEVNSILIVGAMAVSPDVLPVAAACVALVDWRPRLAGRAIVTLAIGLGSTCAAAAALAGSLDLLDLLPAGYQLDDGAVLGLTTVNEATIGVALAAGIAAMLAIETRASSAVGVAISITTIPAAAYFGVAIIVGATGKAWGALAVLGTNVAMLLVAGTTTLIVQRGLRRRNRYTAPPVRGTGTRPRLGSPR
jgi:uncharacterized hydrophobic protein (TIGR00271 family)